MSDYVIASATPGWYRDPQRPGTLRYFDGASWTQHVAPAPVAAASVVAGPPAPFTGQPQLGPSGIGADPSDPVHWLLPTGRTWQSIAAGYVALFAMVAWFLGPVAVGLGIWALTASRRSGAHGRGRAIFAIVVGTVATVVLIAVVLQAF
jgi:Protein of unknown function (DUF2510)/Domain of unknown function (DUF4190)